MLDCFQDQVYIASFYIFFDVMAKHWPVVFLGYELMYFFDTKVTCKQIIVMPTNKLCLDDFRDIKGAMVV